MGGRGLQRVIPSRVERRDDVRFGGGRQQQKKKSPAEGAAVRNRLAIGLHSCMRAPLVTAESLGPLALGSSRVVMVAMVVSSCFACAVLGGEV